VTKKALALEPLVPHQRRNYILTSSLLEGHKKTPKAEIDISLLAIEREKRLRERTARKLLF